MTRKQNTNSTNIEKLLNQQTVTILDAVDKKINFLDKKINGIDNKLEKFEERVNIKIDKLTTLIDKFVNLYTKQEQEFKIMKYELNQIKKVIKEKLGIEIS
ncbi:MAG TPA: hypothetical protein VMW82_00505 [Candidatus Paceibacterota bacterium]|nr:hypothetical protein [Candidatus Paceibacterota bacterium]